MLRLTDNAKAAITGITSQSGLPETGGVRLSLTTDADEVEMSLSPEPQSGDEVIEEDGARVFLEEAASTLLAEHMLDAEAGPDGVGFALRQASWPTPGGGSDAPPLGAGAPPDSAHPRGL